MNYLGHIYVIGFKNGLIKVGKCNDPIIRMRRHDKNYGRISPIVVKWISVPHTNYSKNERLLIERLDNLQSEIGKYSFDSMILYASTLEYSFPDTKDMELILSNMQTSRASTNTLTDLYLMVDYRVIRQRPRIKIKD